MTDRKITKQVIVDVSIKEVWRKWTTEEGLKTFFVKDCKAELKVGGAFEMYFNQDAPPGSRGSEGCKILSFLPEKMLSFSWNAPPTIPAIRALGDVAWVVVFFEETGTDRTQVELNHLGFGEGKDWDETYEYFQRAWGMVMEWFENNCKGIGGK